MVKMKNLYWWVILLISYSTFAMEEDIWQIPHNRPGIFLDAIVSEYKNPVRISRMPIEKDNFSGYQINESNIFAIEHLAVVNDKGTQFLKREIRTNQHYVAKQKSVRNTIVEMTCVRIEDLLHNGIKTYVWLHKYLLDLNNKDKQRGSVTSNYGSVVEKFEFDPIHPSCTLVTLKLLKKDSFIGRDERVVVESKTNPLVSFTGNFEPKSGLKQ